MPLKGNLDEQVINKIISLLEELEFGTIHITVHDSQITQIERVEKYRVPLQKKTPSQTVNQPRGKE